MRTGVAVVSDIRARLPMQTRFTAQTDQPNVFTVDSAIMSAVWVDRCGIPGTEVACEVRTALVGEGSTIRLVGKTENGKRLGKIKDTIFRNVYRGTFVVPDKVKPGDLLFFEVKLPKLGLSAESNRIPVRPQIQVRTMAWDRTEARRGDILTLTCAFDSPIRDNTEATVIIYEYDRDGNHDPVIKIPTTVMKGKVELKWEFEYFEDTAEIPTEDELRKYGKHYSPPEYFFVVVVEGVPLGREQQSGLVRFRDTFEQHLLDSYGMPLADHDVVLHLPDGSRKDVKTDDRGIVRLEETNPGPVLVQVKTSS